MNLQRPPSAPENPISTLNDTSVTLEWSPPRDNGGRGDVTYNIHCRKCPGDSRKCGPCGSGIHFVPRQFGLSMAKVLVSDLLSNTNYTFIIEAVNGVSDLSPSPKQQVTVNITTGQTEVCLSIWRWAAVFANPTRQTSRYGAVEVPNGVL
ncbi:hypothetical protein NFI96_004016 [Prochilodus magdalenae]|nr:hypothetical protein NFI96_004016 [Prochilodus magdalenae]